MRSLIIVSIFCVISLIAVGFAIYFQEKAKNPCTICPETVPVVRIVDGEEVVFRCSEAAISLDEKCVLRGDK